MNAVRKKSDYTILVVEDDEILREVVAGLLKRCGFKVLEADGGKPALTTVKDKHVDLILSDICMPDGDGHFLLNEVRKIHPAKPPLIFVTGFAEKSTKESLKLGAFLVLSKPCPRPVLLGAIDQALGLNIEPPATKVS